MKKAFFNSSGERAGWFSILRFVLYYLAQQPGVGIGRKSVLKRSFWWLILFSLFVLILGQ